MSKSKKNTIDPEKIIESYGADAVRLFILSDSPPEKDVQWSEEGIASSYKFIQKLWLLNSRIIDMAGKNYPDNENDEISKYTNKFIKKITHSIENFSYNVIIANLHEMHSFLTKEIIKKYKKDTLLENYEKILAIMLPIIPHFANECLEIIGVKKNLKWPIHDEKQITDNKTLFVIQINGKKRGLIEIEGKTSEEELFKKVLNNKSMLKYLENKSVKRKIFIPSKLMNIII